MKLDVKDIPQTPPFEPREVTILLETEGEAKAFHHLFGCGTVIHCGIRDEAFAIKEEIYKQIRNRLPT